LFAHFQWVIIFQGAQKMKQQLFCIHGTLAHDPAIDQWLNAHTGELSAIASQWLTVMRGCGDELREAMHDGCPTFCLGEFPFAYVNIFTAHVNLGFFQGAALRDPANLLEGSGKSMRHVKLRPGMATNTRALARLIEEAYQDMKGRVQQG
jgi:hypothetical protein